VQTLTPATAIEGADAIRSVRSLRVAGLGTKSVFLSRFPDCDAILSTRSLTGIVEWRPEDLVVVVRAGTSVRDLQDELGAANQEIPIGDGEGVLFGLPGTIGGLVAAGLPTITDRMSRGVRYWVLGLTLIRGDGTIVKCGSKAVKNVAGYDVHRALVGSWGSLGLITEVVLRVFAKHADHATPIARGQGTWNDGAPFEISNSGRAVALDRFSSYAASFVDEEMGTVWGQSPTGGFDFSPGGVLRARFEPEQMFSPVTNAEVKRKLKSMADPDNRFDPAMSRAICDGGEP
jgi:FAD/FMN-containing dehydrogenase